jgi:nucleotide-binding universal stress UspA family protein
MDEKEPTGIVVGVDGGSGGVDAVRYGASEAARQATSLTLLHVIPDYVPMAAPLPMPPDDLHEVGGSLLARTEATASQLAPGTQVTSLLRTGHAATVLAQTAARARAVVLGRETVAPWERVFTGAVTMGVAARAACPVIAVPDGWTADTPQRGQIVVGSKSAGHDRELLQRAFEVAATSGDRLTILHAWELTGVYDDIIVRRTHDTDWDQTAQRQIEDKLEELRAAHPDVAVDVRVVHRQPAHALRVASRDADLLLLGRRGVRRLLGLGSTARALLREAACPVEIVPPRPVLEAEDSLAVPTP